MDAVLLNGLWEGAPIVAIAWLITLAIPRRQAATRYAIWFTALLALVVLPIVSLWHPQPDLAVPPPLTFAAGPAHATHAAAIALGVWVVALWLVGVTFFLARLAYSYMRIRALMRRAVAAPELGELVVTSREIELPIAAGAVAPRIVIPERLATSLDPTDLASIIAHERAHIRRGDIFGNFVQRCIEAVLFFNPWVYLIGRALVGEREAACDDWVVAATGDAGRYASCLTNLAGSGVRGRMPLLTPSAIGSRRMLVGRIARLLNGKGIHVNVNRPVIALSVLLFSALAYALQTAGSLADAAPAPNPNLPASCYHNVKILNPAVPHFPASARSIGDADAVVLVTVAADGSVAGTKVVKSSGNAAIDNATVAAAKASTYSPEVSHCKAEEGQYLFRAEFNSQ